MNLTASSAPSANEVIQFRGSDLLVDFKNLSPALALTRRTPPSIQLDSFLSFSAAVGVRRRHSQIPFDSCGLSPKGRGSCGLLPKGLGSSMAHGPPLRQNYPGVESVKNFRIPHTALGLR